MQRIGENLDNLVRKYWKEEVSLALFIGGTLIGEKYMPNITYHIYDYLDPDLPEQFAQFFYDVIPWPVRFVETGVLGAPLLRQLKKRLIPEERYPNLLYRAASISKRWFKTGLVAGALGTTLIAAYPHAAPVVKKFAVTKYGELKSGLQQYVEGFIKPELKLDETDINAVIKNLGKNPGEVAKYLQNKWVRKYSDPKDLKPNLERAIERSKPEITTIKTIFKKYGIPEEIAFLAITESHWRWNAESPMKARGLYQFIVLTAKKSGCNVDLKLNYDERLNGFLSADCAARHLRYLHRTFNSDWNLALATYNSGMPWRYKAQAEQKGEEISYQGYLRFLSQELKKIKSKERLGFIKENLNYPPHYNAIVQLLKTRYPPYFKRKAKEEFVILKARYPTLNDLSRHYDIPLNDLRKLNPHIRDRLGRLPRGARIVVPKHTLPQPYA